MVNCVYLLVTLWTEAQQTSLSFPVSRSLLRFISIELVMPSNHLILCHHPILQPSVLPSIRGFSSESAINIRWPKYCSFSFSNSPPNEHSGLISFRIDWLDLLAVQDSQESFPAPQFKSISSSVLSLFYRPILISVLDYWKKT